MSVHEVNDRQNRDSVEDAGAGSSHLDHSVLVRGLGTFEVAINGRTVQHWRAGKARSLFQYLLLRPGRTMTREALNDSLWPHSSSATSSGSLKVAVHTIRKILTDHETPDSDEAGTLQLETCDSGYLLRVENAWVDFQVFDRLIDKAHRAQSVGDVAGAHRLYAEAVGLYQGDFLPGVTADWAEMHREWLRSRTILALDWLVETDLARRDHLSVIRWCRRCLEIEPYREETYRTLIVMHGRLGQISQARRWFKLCYARLRDDLQVQPEPETRRLLERVVRGDLRPRGEPAAATLRYH